MKCLLKYQWVKLPRNQLPPGKGIMGAWARLASRAAFSLAFMALRSNGNSVVHTSCVFFIRMPS